MAPGTSSYIQLSDFLNPATMQVLRTASSTQLHATAEVHRSRAHLLAVESQLHLMHARQDDAQAQAQDSILDMENRLEEGRARLGQLQLDLDSACGHVQGLDRRNNM